MDKQTLISITASRLSSIGISPKFGQGTDILVNCEFLDTGWNTGNKRINYDALAYYDESNMTVFFWELTKETGSGFSFGSESESSFQSGKTLFRKVKGVAYGPDGKAYEYNLNLGAIPKAFKECAQANGWKFKTVLRREKASYPPGASFVQSADYQNQPLPPYTPPQASYTQQQPYMPQNSYNYNPNYNHQVNSQQNFGNPQGGFYAKGSRNSKDGRMGVFSWVVLILLALVTIMLFVISKTSVTGWVLAATVLAGMIFLQHKTPQNRWAVRGMIWVMSFIVLFLVYAFTTDTSKNSSTNSQVSFSEGKKVESKTSAPVVDGIKGTFYCNTFDFTSATPQSIIFKADTGGKVVNTLLKTAESTASVKYHMEWLYFIRNNNIFRMKTDGSSMKQLTSGDAYVTKYDVSDSGIIFSWDNTNASDNIFARVGYMSHDGSEARIVYEGIPDQMWAEPDGLFFISMEARDRRNIFRLSPDFKSAVKLETGPVGNFCLDGGWIYYNNTDAGYKLHRVKKDGTGKEKVSDVEFKYTRAYSSPPFKVQKDYILFLNNDDDRRLYRVKFDGSGKSLVTEDKVQHFMLIGDVILYSGIGKDGPGLYSIKGDGSGKKRLAEKEAVDFSFVVQ